MADLIPRPSWQTRAVISDDKIYRYALFRRWARAGRTVCYLMLNPSIADHEKDDPTVRRCIGFAIDHGFNAMSVVNLFAYRSTDPRQMFEDANAGRCNPEGPDNDRWIRATVEKAEEVVFAWGAHDGSPCAPLMRRRRAKVAHDVMCDMRRWPQCLGTCGDGNPRHPLYVRRKERFRLWRFPDEPPVAVV